MSRHLPSLVAIGLMACATSPTPVPPSPPEASALRGAHDSRSIPATITRVPDLRELLADARRGGSREVRFVEAGAAQRRCMRAWARQVDGDGRAPCLPAGFEPVRVDDAPGLIALRELPDQRRGGGVYVVRPEAATPLVVEVPHSYFDLHTLDLGVAIFEALEARALLVNTAHRHRATPDDCDAPGPRPCSADAAHNPRSLFQQAHRGLAVRYPDATFVSVHGFERRPDDPMAILSPAKTRSQIGGLAAAFRRLLPDYTVLEYPHQIQRLGGTTSSQARDLVRRGGRFVHVELARDLRERLTEDAALRARFVRAFLALVPGQVGLEGRD